VSRGIFLCLVATRLAPFFFLYRRGREEHGAELCNFCVCVFVRTRHSKNNNFKKFCRPTTVGDGSHNVSRWMTWLPISLKNAAKCDKWYQLQNLSITESLNANGARKKAPLVFNSEHAMSSVSNKKPKKKQILCLAIFFFRIRKNTRKRKTAGAVALSVPAFVGAIEVAKIFLRLFSSCLLYVLKTRNAARERKGDLVFEIHCVLWLLFFSFSVLQEPEKKKKGNQN
jgi:preprotein translocase subunit YajC